MKCIDLEGKFCTTNNNYLLFLHAIPNKFVLSLYRYGICYDLNFAVNRKCEKVRERSRTGSRTPTSGAGRDKFARGGKKI
jgi:hypothetical protein